LLFFYGFKIKLTMNIPYIYKSGRLFMVALGLMLSTFLQAQALKANLDYAHTVKNQSVLVDALANDENKQGARIDKIVLANHCTATLEDGRVRVTPEEDFKGVALVRYTVFKDGDKTNDCGLIIVDVASNPLPYYYKFNLFVLKNSTTQFTLPVNYVKARDPKFGRLVPIKAGVWEFQALANDNGYDDVQFAYTANGQTKLHEVHFDVLREAQTFVNNDYFSALIGKPITVDVLANDSSSTIYRKVTIGNSVGGTVKDLLGGKVEFTPSLRESGIAYFYYSVEKVGGGVETGVAQIYVSNFLPAKDVYQITTTGIATIIRYVAPVNGFTLETTNTKSGSSVKFYANLDTTIKNRELKGKNVLLYDPIEGTLDDEFFVKYCPNNGTNCSNYVKVKVQAKDDGVSGNQLCGSDCVIPGDANNDGEVNILDIFPVGINMGAYGKVRENDVNPIEWYPRKSADWDNTIAKDNPNNMKHADTDGDGVITVGDVDAIRLNYGKHNAIIPTISIANSDVTVEATTSLTSVGPGDLIEFLVSMGTPSNPAYKAKGLTFTVNYEADQIKDNSLSVDFGGFNWLSRYDAFLPFDAQRERGVHDAGMVRTKDNGTSGHGVVGKVRAVVEETVAGFRIGDKPTLKLRLTNATMLNETGLMVRLPDVEVEVPIVLRKKEEKIKNDDLVTYPNPANGQVNFHINGINTIEYVRLMDATGREVMRVNVDAKAAQLQTGGLSNGLYIAEVMTEKGRIMRKVEIVK
jgi:Secretion system C-terminal sorting domain